MMKITYYGHSCFGVEVGPFQLLFDPFISPNDLAKHIDVESVPADFIFISHGHFDHIQDAAPIATRTGAKVICNFEVSEWLGKQGVENVHPMNHGGQYGFEFGRAKFVSAVHSSVLPDGAYGGNPGGFVVETGEGTFYYSGDTALTMDMKLIGESVRLNFAVLCIGDNFTMGVRDAIRACDFIGCDRVVGVHYDTFPPIKLDHEEAIQAFKASGKELRLLDIGGSAEF